MNKVTITLSALCFLLSTQISIAQTKKKAELKQKKSVTAPVKEINQDEMMQAWQKYMTPTSMHEMLTKSDGEWAGEVTHWMTPQAEPIMSRCVAVNKMVMGGRYQISNFKGEFMGMPFEGINTLAFDNAKKVFVSSWIDNMGSGMMNLEGAWNEKTKSINFKGKMVDPMTGKDTDAKETFTLVDDNTQIMEMFAPKPDGSGMFKTMEIKFTRK